MYVAGFGLGAAAPNRLSAGQQLRVGEELRDKTGKGRVVLQKDGNLVLYAGSAPLWSSRTVGKPVTYVTMQSDGNFVAYDKNKTPHWSTRTAGNPGAYVVFQDDGNLVVYKKDNKPAWSSNTAGWYERAGGGFNPLDVITKPVNAIATAAETVFVKPVNLVVDAVKDIPVVGDITRIAAVATGSPLALATSIASGGRIDKVVADNFKQQLRMVKDAAPYAQTVISVVPGVGNGVAGVIGAGAALADGQPITEAIKSGVRGALPGGALAQAGFDAAMKVAAGQNVAQSVLESARNAIPDGPARKAFDVGLAVATGENIQNAVTSGVMSLAPAQLQNLADVGGKLVSQNPALKDAMSKAGALTGAKAQAFQLATGLLSQANMNGKALAVARTKVSKEALSAFDAALKTQQEKMPWVKEAIGSDPQTVIKNLQSIQAKVAQLSKPPPMKSPAPLQNKPPQMSAPAKTNNMTNEVKKSNDAANAVAAQKIAAAIDPNAIPVGYPPYPAMDVGTSGFFSTSNPNPSWGPAITNMTRDMDWAGRSAVNGARGAARVVQGPGGQNYLFEMGRNGVLTARQQIQQRAQQAVTRAAQTATRAARPVTQAVQQGQRLVQQGTQVARQGQQILQQGQRFAQNAPQQLQQRGQQLSQYAQQQGRQQLQRAQQEAQRRAQQLTRQIPNRQDIQRQGQQLAQQTAQRVAQQVQQAVASRLPQAPKLPQVPRFF